MTFRLDDGIISSNSEKTNYKEVTWGILLKVPIDKKN